jgi:hypothetical protein
MSSTKQVKKTCVNCGNKFIKKTGVIQDNKEIQPNPWFHNRKCKNEWIFKNNSFS